MPSSAFLVIQWKGGAKAESNWEIQGIFSSRAQAINACKTDRYCFAKYEIDEELSADTVRGDQWTFPVEECKKALQGLEAQGGKVELSDPNSRFNGFRKG